MTTPLIQIRSNNIADHFTEEEILSMVSKDKVQKFLYEIDLIELPISKVLHLYGV